MWFLPAQKQRLLGGRRGSGKASLRRAASAVVGCGLRDTVNGALLHHRVPRGPGTKEVSCQSHGSNTWPSPQSHGAHLQRRRSLMSAKTWAGHGLDTGWKAGLRWGDPRCRREVHQVPFRQLPLIPCRREGGKMKEKRSGQSCGGCETHRRRGWEWPGGGDLSCVV